MSPMSVIHDLDALETATRSESIKGLRSVFGIADWLISIAPALPELLRQTLPNHALVVHFAFLKQALTCLRSVQILVLSGYTVPAAAVAASVFEFALYSGYIRRDQARLLRYLRHANSQDFVWKPSQIIRELAATDSVSGKTFVGEELQRRIDLKYGPYVFLNVLKHGNPTAFRHVVMASSKASSEVVGAPRFGVVPDSRSEDRIVKAAVMAHACRGVLDIMAVAIDVSEVRTHKALDFHREITVKYAKLTRLIAGYHSRFGSLPFPVIRKKKKAG